MWWPAVPLRVAGPFGRTAYDVRASNRSRVEYEWVLIGPPLFDPASWVGLTGALLRRHTWWPCQTAGMGASGDGWLWGPGCVTGPDDEVH